MGMTMLLFTLNRTSPIYVIAEQIIAFEPAKIDDGRIAFAPAKTDDSRYKTRIYLTGNKYVIVDGLVAEVADILIDSGARAVYAARRLNAKADEHEKQEAAYAQRCRGNHD